MKTRNTSQKKAKRYAYNIGDLVACYENSDTYKVLVGWINERWKRDDRIFYKVTWSDFEERQDIINTPIKQEHLDMCYNLLQKALELDVWEGKKII